MIKGVVSLCATKYDKQNTPPGLNYNKRFCTDWVFDDICKSMSWEHKSQFAKAHLL